MPAKSAAYLEFHIEQGPVLESRNLALGIVEGLAGQSRCRVEFRGKAGHAGTNPMNLRKDALAGAAQWVAASGGNCGALREGGRDGGTDSSRAGRRECDSREWCGAVSTCVMRRTWCAMRWCGRFLMRRTRWQRGAGCRWRRTQYHEHPAVRLDAGLVALAERAAEQAGYATIRMTSGAGHDAMVIAPHVPSAMVFLRNPGGISHHPDESVAEEDVAAAIHMGLCLLDGVCNRL